MQLKYSFIIPVFNRPAEIRELLQSMSRLRFSGDFEVVIVEDGSEITSEAEVEEFRSQLEISYYYKPNTGPGDSRNFGMLKASGNYFLILDSDVILPADYLEKADEFLSRNYTDCFGGPDAAHEDFTDLQKAINYVMTSFLTTGGIRGKKKSVAGFQPRSFNMGLSKNAFMASGGFGKIHPGEDPDLALRLRKLGLKTSLAPNVVVFHKRRVSWDKFYKQVYKFGLARPVLNHWHPESAKPAYWFPSFFLVGLIFAIIMMFLGWPWLFLFFLGYFILTGLDAAIKNKSLYIGSAAVLAALIQFTGYGYGFLTAVRKLKFSGLSPQVAFPNLFFYHAKQDEAEQSLD